MDLCHKHMTDSEALISNPHMHIRVSECKFCLQSYSQGNKRCIINGKGNQIHIFNKDVASRVTQEGWLHVQSSSVSCSHMYVGIKSHIYPDTGGHLCTSPSLHEDFGVWDT